MDSLVFILSFSELESHLSTNVYMKRQVLHSKREALLGFLNFLIPSSVWFPCDCLFDTDKFLRSDLNPVSRQIESIVHERNEKFIAQKSEKNSLFNRDNSSWNEIPLDLDRKGTTSTGGFPRRFKQFISSINLIWIKYQTFGRASYLFLVSLFYACLFLCGTFSIISFG